jgi:DNA-directed RNA polymerase omega subunit
MDDHTTKRKQQGNESIRSNDVLYFEQLLPNGPQGSFRVARMAMIRAMEIHTGSRPLVEHTLLDKPTTIAMREIAQGKVWLGKPGGNGKTKEIEADSEGPEEKLGEEQEAE